MINERAIELINAESDGELAHEDEAELEQLLAQSAEARQYQAELRQLSAFLRKVPDVAMPDNLHAQVLAGIRLPRPSKRPGWFRLDEMPVALKFGLATAAGLVLAVGLYSNREEFRNPGDISQMVGTLTRDGQGQARAALDTFAFEQDGSRASVSLLKRDGALVMDVSMESDTLLEFEADFSADGLAIEAFAQLQSDLASIEVADRRLIATGQGAQSFAVLLQHNDTDAVIGSTGIALAFKRDGVLIQEGKLKSAR